MYKKVLNLKVLLIITTQALTAQNVTVSGYVRETKTEEILPGATISVEGLSGTISNRQGYYNLRIPKGKNRVTCSFVGYEPNFIEVNIKRDTIINFNLSPKTTTIDEVVVKHEGSNRSFLDKRIGTNRITSLEVKSQPVLLGESDILKALQLLPGIQSGNEGSSGLYIRGGSPDQNLVLLDGVPIYNSYHLFGFFSVFNTDAIRDANVIKGGIPARYSGRLSSVLDITMKEGDMSSYGGEVTIGLVASKFVLEGPFQRGKGSFLVTGRRTNIDLLSKDINGSYVGNKGNNSNKFYFYDINLKLNYLLTSRSRVFLSFYSGRDESSALSINKESNIEQSYLYLNKRGTDLNWGNLVVSTRYNLIVSPRAFINFTAYSSNYDYMSRDNSFTSLAVMGTEFKKEIEKKYISNINDLGARLDIDYLLHSMVRLKGGVHFIKHGFKPGIESFKVDDLYPDQNIDTLFGKKIFSHEISTYIESDVKLFKKIDINAGVNYNTYKVSDTLFNSIEPRIGINLPISDKTSIKASYSKLSQNCHMLSNSTLGLPTDLWLPATSRIIPQKGEIFSIGLFTILKSQYQLSVETFLKNMKNLIAYREGANYFSGSLSWDDKVTNGKGWSYGCELLVQKTTGKVTGTFAYTLSKSERKFTALNEGKTFPYKYDRRHDISINVNYNLKPNRTLSATWVYGTGNAVTAPNMVGFTDEFYGGFGFFHNTYQIIEELNNVRMPSYHRLDIGANFHKKLKWATQTISIGIYNLYNRHNPYYIYMYYAPEGPVIKQKSLFPILPYVSYSLKF